MASPSTQKALTMRKIDGKPGSVYYPLQISQIPIPTPSPTELLLRPTYLSLNHRDLFLRQHLYPAPSFTTPLLSDAVCTVLPHPCSPASSSSSSQFQPGTRVLLNPGHGWISDPAGPETLVKATTGKDDKKAAAAGYAILGGTRSNPLGCAQETLTVESEEVVPCPDHLTGEEACALPLVGLTAWRAVVTKSGQFDHYSYNRSRTGGGKKTTTENGNGKGIRVKNSQDKGEGEGEETPSPPNFLVTGIGGGVALMALQFITALGGKCWVTSSSPAKIARAVSELGAEGGVSYLDTNTPPHKTWDLLTLLPPAHPHLDAIIDGSGSPNIIDRATRLLKPGGVVVSYGMTAASTIDSPTPRVQFGMSAVLKNIELRGSTMGSRREFEDMVAFVGERVLRPVVCRVVNGGWGEGDGDGDGESLLEKLDSLWDEMRGGKQFGKLVWRIEGGGVQGNEEGNEEKEAKEESSKL